MITEQFFVVEDDPSELSKITTQHEKVVIHNCSLQKWPPKLLRASGVKYLDLSENGIFELPDFQFFKKLEFLFLGKNQLSAIPETVSKCEQLVSLVLCQNRFAQFPEPILGLSQLQCLDLSHNQLTDLPFGIGTMVGLNQLNLSRNELSSLPEDFAQLTQLSELDLSHNKLTVFPVHLAPLPLKELKLGNNILEDFSDWEQSGFTQLEVLDLKGNQLSALPCEAIDQITTLKILDITGNHFTS